MLIKIKQIYIVKFNTYNLTEMVCFLTAGEGFVKKVLKGFVFRGKAQGKVELGGTRAVWGQEGLPQRKQPTPSKWKRG